MQFDGTFDGYQVAAEGTAIYPEKTKPIGLLYVVLGLAGESGEIANDVKKLIRDTNFLQSNTIDAPVYDKIVKELGDVLWYLGNICTELHIDFEDIAYKNLEKLYSRKERGTLGGSGDER